MELMIVIAILGLLSVFAVPGVLEWRSGASLRGAVNNLKGDLELAKLKAIQVNDTVVIHFTENGYHVFKDDGPQTGLYDDGETIYGDRTLPAGVTIDLGETNFDQKSARFKGRGTADSGSTVLVNASGTKKKITISSLGRITISSEE
jgi:Tfp pilus assembly protein FimT